MPQPEREENAEDSGSRSPECMVRHFDGKNVCACVFNQTLIPMVGTSGSLIF